MNEKLKDTIKKVEIRGILSLEDLNTIQSVGIDLTNFVSRDDVSQGKVNYEKFISALKKGLGIKSPAEEGFKKLESLEVEFFKRDFIEFGTIELDSKKWHELGKAFAEGLSKGADTPASASISHPLMRETMEVPFLNGSEHTHITVDKEKIIKEMYKEMGLPGYVLDGMSNSIGSD